VLRCELESERAPYSFDTSKLSESALTILGNATQTLSNDLLHTVAQAVRSWDRTHKE